MRYLIIILSFLFFPICGNSQQKERPFIWASYNDRAEILNKIEKYEWAGKFYDDLKKKVDNELNVYNKDKDSFLRRLPLDWNKQSGGTYPPFYYLPLNDKDKLSKAVAGLVNSVQLSTDCGVMYYLTGNEVYAQCALDISYSIVMGLKQTVWDENAKTNGGWIYPDDNLRELRYMASLPVVYDFIYPYIMSGAKAYNLVSKHNEKPELDVYQYVFNIYARSAVEHGHSGSNWSVLEASCLVNSALAMENMDMREKYLEHFLNISNSTQDCIRDIAKEYKNKGDIWPETSQYSNGVADLTTKLMLIMDRYNPSLGLGAKYVNIPWSLPRWSELVFPNGDLVRFGDGHRHGGASPIQLEVAYALAEREGLTELKERMGGYILRKINEGKYNRPVVDEKYSIAVEPYYDPAMLLWCAGEIEGTPNETKLPRTDNLSHAGLYLQRNLSPNGKKEDGLMAFVAGASFVHSHAGGMNIELYGKGEVIGVDGGRGAYQKDIHENYSRLYAAHNCVISNGKSSSYGDWVNLGTSTVEMVSMEPEPWEDAVSENYSYSTTIFEDKAMGVDNALHQRTLAVVRTSPTTGYYVDVFRAKSDNENQYHDYLYHNIADEVKLKDNKPTLFDTPERFNASASLPWKKNSSYRHPGWHFFKNVKTSAKYESDVTGIFKAENLGENGINMRFFISGEPEREYSFVDAPATFEVDKKYSDKPTPTIVVRKYGDAWNRPFAVVYEPTSGLTDNGSVVKVDKLQKNGIFKGLCVKSIIEGKELIQYIIIQDATETFKIRDIEFTGHFAIVSYSGGKLKDVYVGNGSKISVGGKVFYESKSGEGNFYSDAI